MSKSSSASSSADAETWAIVVAAGRGSRFGAPKQFASVAGRPLLAWTLEPFLAEPEIAGTIVVLPAESAPPSWLRALADSAARPVRLVCGGATRGDSVAAGLRALPDSARWVVVHDGVRPCVTPEMIRSALGRASEGVAAIVGRPVTDTLKEVDDALRVRAGPAREGLWRAQTPQAFPRAMLERAYREAQAAGRTATDCAALCEAIGERVVMVDAGGPNPKVTTAADLAWVAAWLGRPERDED